MKEQLSFCFPLDECRAFNADYDGDEMNVHAVRSFLSISEAAYCMPASRGINTAQRNGPVGGCEHDTLAAMWMLTDGASVGDEVQLVPLHNAMNCIVHAEMVDFLSPCLKRCKGSYPDYIYIGKDGSAHFNKEKGSIPGKLLVSILFPGDFSFTKTTNKIAERPTVQIKDGVILPSSGPLDKDMLGGKRNNIIHYMWLEYGPAECQRFLTRIRKIAYLWITNRGFSVGLRDCILTTEEDVRKLLAVSDAKCEEILSTVVVDEAGKMDKEIKLNTELNNLMGSVIGVVSKVMHAGRKNALNIMKDSGAKGSALNCSQIAGFVGQQNINGRRPAKLLSGRTRRLPYFEPGDDSPEAGGFVYNSYIHGLSVSEFFFAAQGGRIGVIDTSVKTQDSGYAHRRISKKLEDFVVRTDGSIRDSEGCIVQFQYGDDGMDAINLVDCPGCKFPMSVDVRRHSLRFRGVEPRKLTSEEINLIASQFRIGPIMSELTDHVSNIVIRAVKQQLADVEIEPEQIARFARKVIDCHAKASAAYGTSVGLIAACSLGESQTQGVLNTFHTSGVAAKDVTLGLPRFNELLNATRKPSKPVIQVAFRTKKAGASELVPEDVNTLGNKRKMLEGVVVSQLIESSEMFATEKAPSVEGVKAYIKPMWRDIYDALYETPETDEWVIRLKFSLRKLIDFNISLAEVSSAIAEDVLDTVVRSPEAFAEIEIYVNSATLSSQARGKIAGLDSHITEENMSFFLSRNVVLKTILSTQVCGVYGICRTIVRKDDGRDCPFADGTKDEWVIDAMVGEDRDNAFLGVLVKGLEPKSNIDINKTWTTDLWETLDILGIEAARALLFSEFMKVLSFDGTYINPRHLQLLVDAMTRNGSLTSVRRDGISDETGVLAQGLFERSIDVFSTAAMFGKVDELKGLSGGVVIGALVPVGTGAVTVKSKDEL